MAGFLARLFEPKIVKLEAEAARLREQLKDADEAHKFWYERCVDLEAQLKAETATNRTREDLLVNAALRSNGAEGVPIREKLAKSGVESPESEAPIDDATLKILEARAEEMAKAEYGENVTDELIAQVLKHLKTNPEYYASN